MANKREPSEVERDAINAYNRAMYHADPAYRARRLANGAAFRARNPNYMRDYHRDYYRTHREELREKNRQWREAHPNYFSDYYHKRKEKEKSAHERP